MGVFLAGVGALFLIDALLGKWDKITNLFAPFEVILNPVTTLLG